MSRVAIENQEDILQQAHEELQEPPLYKVLLLNDDYTSMEFVIGVLMQVFNKPLETATQIMLHVHHQGVGMCGVYPFEIAETKITTVHARARENGFPLQCIMEKA